MVDARVVQTERCKDAGSGRAGKPGRDGGRRSATCMGEPGAADDRGEAHLSLPLLVTGIAANDHGRTVPLDHAAALAHGLDRRTDFHQWLPMPVGDPAAGEVVGAELDLDLVSRKDAN